MSGVDQDLKKGLKALGKQEAIVFTATVLEVNQDKKTVTVKDVDELEYYDVRLAAAEDDKKSVLTIPKVNSSVLVCQIGNDLNTLFVVQTNEVENIIGVISDTKFEINDAGFKGEIGDSKFEITTAGYKIDKGSENLKTVFNDMVDELNKIIVVNGTTINVAAMTIIKQRLNTILIE